MSAILEPTNYSEVVEAVRSAPRILAMGAGTKPALCSLDGFTRLSTARLSGIVEYDPSEFTFTAKAGTPLREIVAALHSQGQYLPFDPPLVAAGATLGGMTASGLDGPGRFRFGGLRCFILGVRFVDGSGCLLKMGGKVVKNAAGFDLPKFFVGSLGSFGVLAEITFKVFPRPAGTVTLRFPAKDAAAIGRLISEAAQSSWEFEALEASLSEEAVFARLAAPESALSSITSAILNRWDGRILSHEEATVLWQRIDEFSWSPPGEPCWKIPLRSGSFEIFARLAAGIPGSRSWISAANNVGYLSFPEREVGALNERLVHGGFSALALRGSGLRLRGVRPNFEVFQAVKRALDPDERFPPVLS